MMAVLLAIACGTPTPPVDTVFVRGGILAPAGAGGRPVGGGRELVVEDWVAGVERFGATAPVHAECTGLFSVRLADVSVAIARGAEPPDTSLAFSPDGAWLAIGAYTGEVVIVDAWTGVERARRVLPEAIAKRVAWSPDGAVLYVGEQSAEARLYALDAVTLAERFSLSFGDDVGRSTPPDGDDIYGVYQLPGVFALEVGANGELFVVAVHGWVDETGARRNASRAYAIGADGTIRARWPANGAADATLMSARLDGTVAVLPVSRSADGEPPSDLPIGGIIALDIAGFVPKATLPLIPLAPWFHRVFVWEALDLSVARDLALIGTGDGRVGTWRLSDGSPQVALDPGVPIDAAGVPIAASVGFARIASDTLLAVTSGTNIPYGAADPSLRPPRAHPNENALWAWSLDGSRRWSWRGPERLQGLALSPDARTIVVGAGVRDTDERADLFGALVFRREGEGTGEQRLEATCPTAGPVFFRMAVADDGRIAVAEHPWRRGASVEGSYRVTVLR